MSSSTDPDEIRADIERTRAELSYNVDELADTANPKNIAHRQVDKMKGAVGGVRDKIMGSPDDPYDEGAIGGAKGAVADGAAAVQGKAAAAGDAIAHAPSAAKSKTRGNPLAAGLIAFGAGLLVSSLIPSSERERNAVSDLQQNLEPVKQKLSDAAAEVADHLKAPAQEAAASIKDSATEAAQHVQEEGSAGRERVMGQAHEAKDNVRDAHSS